MKHKYWKYYISGAQVRFRNHGDRWQTGQLVGVTDFTPDFLLTVRHSKGLDQVIDANARLILRPITDITGPEITAMCQLVNPRSTYAESEVAESVQIMKAEGYEYFNDDQIDMNFLNWTDTIDYLCSIGIDCFNLIDRNLALDATKQ